MCVRVYTGARVCLYSCEYMCVWLHVAAIRTRSWDPNPVTEDPDPLQEIRICARYELDTLAIRRPTHEMTRKPYWFVQWRPDGDSDPKSRHFMWVFVCWSILIPAFYLIISCGCVYDLCIILFISATIIIPWCPGTVLLIYRLHCYRFGPVFLVNSVSHDFSYRW